MKTWFATLLLSAVLPVWPGEPAPPVDFRPVAPAHNLVIVTIDGFRWQELFTGADPDILSNTSVTPDTSLMKMMYDAPDAETRRRRLLPFFWNVIAGKGQLYGNRNYGNKLNVSNLYHLSYPGYAEMFTGHADLRISSNKKKLNPNINVLEYLHGREEFRDKVVAFTSWDVFPYILNEKRSGLPVNSGYDEQDEEGAGTLAASINHVQSQTVCHEGATRHDQLTFMAARAYLDKHRPRVMFIGLGESDEYAHAGRYDLYLQQAAKADQMLSDLWYWLQTTPDYKNNTTLLITTDHGRGNKTSTWSKHDLITKGSSQTWLAMIGPGISPLGEVKEEEQYYQRQLAGLMAGLVGEQFAFGKL
ncbi:hypothetical protein JMG10_08745 [Nostoc ellipsosporum NOK]|nr:hypothetical protein [Nostoc ellipsosporum NOK]